MKDYRRQAKDVKEASILLGVSDCEIRNNALSNIADALYEKREEIFEANRKDLEEGKDLPGPILGRLKFDDHKLGDVINGIRDLIKLDDPIGKVTLKREMDEDLVLTRITCPIGCIGVIFESRPDALVQISSLCIKSGNGAILKGGSEAKHTNRALFDVIYEAGVNSRLPENFMGLIEDRAGIGEIIKCSDAIDLLIPRGSNAFVKYIMDNSEIPVMGHADGICHVYVDRDADIKKAVRIVYDAKTNYVSACNAVETLLVHKDIKDEFMKALKERSGNDIEFIDAKSEEDFVEYLDYKLTVKEVENFTEAINHINRYGSHHTDAIVTENKMTAEIFMNMVDSAGVYWNASTRFADGFRYGFGAEVGISTGKMPPRGPVGLEGLMSYKYTIKGNGHIVEEYSNGTKSYHFRDLEIK